MEEMVCLFMVFLLRKLDFLAETSFNFSVTDLHAFGSGGGCCTITAQTFYGRRMASTPVKDGQGDGATVRAAIAWHPLGTSGWARGKDPKREATFF